MIKLKNNFKIRCKRCNNEHSIAIAIAIANFDDPEITSYERSMGYENEYTWDYKFVCDKNQCSNFVHISIKGYEYPKNMLNFEDYDNGSGFIYITKPSLTIDYD